MPKRPSVIIQDFLKKAGRKGGKARAAKYDRATLSKWAKKGGRPKGMRPGKRAK
jgi:general stress protein YciG